MKPRKDTLTQEELKQILSYDKDTGEFTWLVRTAHKIYVGDTAGYLRDNGYIIIVIKNKNYRAHRLAWLYVNGKFPKDFIDHINGIKNDNRICNLREATSQQNHFNKNVKGYSFDAKKGKYHAYIGKDGKRTNLGYFKTEAEAKAVYLEAKLKYHGKEFSSRLLLKENQT